MSPASAPGATGVHHPVGPERLQASWGDMPAADLWMRTLPRALWRASAWRDLHVTADVAYAERPGCRLDILRSPEATGPRPLVLYVHGGAFRVLSKETHGYPASRYARAGFIVLNVDYRLAPRAPYPAAVQDVHDALRWAVEHAAELGADPQRVVLTGESAGANLVLGLALSATQDRPEPWSGPVRALDVQPVALQLAYGFLQASDTARYGREHPVGPVVARRLPVIERDYLQDAPATAGLDYADPLNVVERLTPHEAAALPSVLAVCGTRDPIAHDTRRLEQALAERGADCTTTWVEGAGHGFHMFPGRRSDQAWRALLAHARQASGLS